LIAGKSGDTADLSRRHSVYEVVPGILGITGGKMTTYRRMARDAVDRIAEDLGVNAKSRTKWIRLGSRKVAPLRAAVERRCKSLGVSPDAVGHLVRCYGDRALEVLDVAAETEATGALVEGFAPVAAEAIYAARSEMAVHLNDLLARRTRLALVDRAAGIGDGSTAAELLTAELGWSSQEVVRQIAAHRSQVEHERALPIGPVAAAPAEQRAQATTA
jgi:glycerol-3-phosphate dehydrogenase